MSTIDTQGLEDSWVRTLVERTADGIVSADADGRISYFNPAAESTFGYSAADVLGKPFTVLLPERHRDAHAASFKQLVARGAEDRSARRTELTACRRDGTELPLELSLLCHEHAGRVGVTAIVRDIADRHAADVGHLRRPELTDPEALAARAEPPLRVAFEDAPIGIALSSPDGRFVQVNRALCEILGCSPADLVGRNFLDITHPDDRQQSVNGLEKLLSGEQPLHRLEKRYRHSDGHWIDAQLSASVARDSRQQPLLVIAQIEDLTERKRVERALSDSLGQLQAVLDNSPISIYMKDLEGRYLVVNRQAASIVELDERELVGKTDYELFAEEMAAPLAAADRRVVKSGELLALEEKLKVGDRELTAFTQKFPIRDAGGHIYAICGISVDITPRIEAESDRRRLEIELEQARHMEGIGRLAGGIAHDFNNLLSVILSYTSLVCEQLSDADPVRRDVEEIERAGERAAELTHQLLVFSRHEHVEPCVLDLNAVVRATARLLRPTVGEDVELCVELEQDLASVEGDRGQIERVLLNLVANARDAMPHGGTLAIRTAEVSLAGERMSEGTAPGRYVRLEVTDTGAGMSDDVAARAFEPFFTTKPPGAGTGFGLATVYGVIHQAGGSVELASRPGEGTTVTVYLPVTEQIDRTEPAEAEPRAVAGRAQKVVVVEDDPAVRRMVCRILTDGGYSVEEVSSPWDALELCASADKRVDLLVTDVVMPSISGGELVQRAKDLRPGLRVLFISGYPDNVTLRHGAERALPFLAKPFAPAELRSRLTTAVNSRPRRGHGVGSLKSCKTMKEDLRRETHRTAVGGD